MRERLIELVRDSVGGCERRCAAHVADYLLANGVIVPPCKVGDTVYTCSGNAYQVVKIVIKKGSKHTTYVLESGLNGQLIFDETYFGKTVFLTREEAEQALKGGEG